VAAGPGRSEVELLPCRPPVVRARDDPARIDDLDAVPVPELVRFARAVELHPDLAGLAGVVRRDRFQVSQRLLCACLDQFACALRRNIPCREASDRVLDGYGRQATGASAFGIGASSGVFVLPRNRNPSVPAS
jgi:hypothetical protein